MGKKTGTRSQEEQEQDRIPRVPRKALRKQSLNVLRDMKTKGKYSKYIDYIRNAGGSPTVEWFDEDWAPLGPVVRQEMEAAKVARVIEGRIYLEE